MITVTEYNREALVSRRVVLREAIEVRNAQSMDVPAGAHGTIRATRFTHDAGWKIGVKFDAFIGTYWLPSARLDFIPVSADTLTDVKAEALARAHEAVAKAYRDLAYALNDLKAVEAR